MKTLKKKSQNIPQKIEEKKRNRGKNKRYRVDFQEIQHLIYIIYIIFHNLQRKQSKQKNLPKNIGNS